MTCIVGLVEKGNVYIGGDSAGVGGYSLTVRADRKVFRNGDFVSSRDYAAENEVPLAEVNKAVGAATYQGYLDL